MQRDIRQENRMNTSTISERQKMFFKNIYQDCRILTPQHVELLFIKM
jgi:hypothetical protein